MSDADQWHYNKSSRPMMPSTHLPPMLPTYFPPMKEDVDNWGHNSWGGGYGGMQERSLGPSVAILMALNKISYVLMFIAVLFFLGIIILLIAMFMPKNRSAWSPPTLTRAERERWLKRDE